MSFIEWSAAFSLDFGRKRPTEVVEVEEYEPEPEPEPQRRLVKVKRQPKLGFRPNDELEQPEDECDCEECRP